MKILIYDDSNEDVENLKNCLDNFMSKKQIAYQVDVCQDSNYFLQEICEIVIFFLSLKRAVGQDVSRVLINIWRRDGRVMIKGIRMCVCDDEIKQKTCL